MKHHMIRQQHGKMFEKVRQEPLRRINDLCSKIDEKVQEIIDKATQKIQTKICKL